jgi:hypothetical protein
MSPRCLNWQASFSKPLMPHCCKEWVHKSCRICEGQMYKGQGDDMQWSTAEIFCYNRTSKLSYYLVKALCQTDWAYWCDYNRLTNQEWPLDCLPLFFPGSHYIIQTNKCSHWLAGKPFMENSKRSHTTDSTRGHSLICTSKHYSIGGLLFL